MCKAQLLGKEWREKKKDKKPKNQTPRAKMHYSQILKK